MTAQAALFSHAALRQAQAPRPPHGEPVEPRQAHHEGANDGVSVHLGRGERYWVSWGRGATAANAAAELSRLTGAAPQALRALGVPHHARALCVVDQSGEGAIVATVLGLTQAELASALAAAR